MSQIMESGSNEAPPSPPPGTQVLSRAIAILQSFTQERPGWTLSALAADLNLPKSTTHRTLVALERSGFLSRNPQGGEYRLGPELIVLGARALKAVDVRDAARPDIEALAEATGEDVTLESRVGWEVLLLHEESSQRILGLGSPVGTLWPAHATATGKVLMAFSAEPSIPPPEGLFALTRHTIVSWEEWVATLEEVRRRGFATTVEELEYGYAAIAAPVRDQTGRPAAAVSIGGPLHRMSEDRMPELTAMVTAAAGRISERLGYRSEADLEGIDE
ncbi:MAG: IclR family transcriptional regulator [Gemmatimonadetes bacterium]|nr:IclR family transcriptional regulator [Gemmatimonadota bacterium]NNM04329.1 IclR family transcriptional regulator [Gemmatimonadota bacterium]